MAKNTNLNLTIRINGKEVKNTLSSVQKEMYKLKREVGKTTRGTEEYVKKSAELKKVTKTWKKMKEEISGVPTLLDKVKDKFGAVGTIAAGIFAVDRILEYGKAIVTSINELRKLKNTVRQITDLNGEALDQATAKIKALSTAFDSDTKKMTESANNFSKQMGIDFDEALDLIEQGFLDGADANGDFLDKVREYPALLDEAGLSAEESIALMTQEIKQGIYSDKGVDAIKEANLRLREMTPAAQEALNAIGLSSKNIQKELRDGSATTFDVIQKVSKRMAALPPQSKLVGQAIADIFGGPGEDAGIKYLANLHKIDLSLNSINSSTDKYTQAKKLEVKANEALNNVWVKLTGTGSGLMLMYNNFKLSLASLLGTLTGVKNESVETRKSFENQAKKVVELDKILPPLINKYDTLKEKKKLSKEEQIELNKTIQQIGSIVPTAITSFDKYGKALDISSDKAKDFITTQKAILKFKNKEAINEAKDALDDYSDRIKELNKELNNTNADGDIVAISNHRTGASEKVSDEKIAQKQAELLELQELELGANKNIEELSGDYLDKYLDREKKKTEKTADEIEARKLLEETAAKFRIKNIANLSDLQLQVEIDKAIQRANARAGIAKENREKEASDLEKRLKKQIEYREKVLISGKTLLEKENIDFENRLKQAGVFGKKRSQLSDKELSVLEVLELQHQTKIAKIELAATNKHLANKKKKYESEKNIRAIAFNNSLAALTSVEEARIKLIGKVSDKELAEIKTLEQAKAALKRIHETEELQKQAEYLESIVSLYTTALQTGEIEGVNFADKILTEEQKEILNEQLEQVRLKLSEVNAEKNKTSGDSPDLEISDTSNLDLFGMNPEQWEESFSNLDTAKGKITALSAVVSGLANAYSMYSKFVSNAEAKQLKKFEKTVNSKIDALEKEKEKELDNDKLSSKEKEAIRKKYDTQIEKLDNDLAKKRADLEYKQAVRSKQIAMMQAVAGTAAGVAQALPNIPLAFLAGAMGALQIGLIASAPLPDRGYKDGGFTQSLGYKDHTGEDVAGVVHADEYVIPKYVMNSTDPYVPQVIQYLEHKRKEKLGYFNSGGHTSTPTPTFTEENETTSSQETTNNNMELLSAINRLNYNLESGISAYVVRDYESYQNQKELDAEFDAIKNNTRQ